MQVTHTCLGVRTGLVWIGVRTGLGSSPRLLRAVYKSPLDERAVNPEKTKGR